MKPVRKDLVDKIKSQDGYYADDPRVVRIVEYTDMGGKQAYALEYEGWFGTYVESADIRNPKVYWEAD